MKLAQAFADMDIESLKTVVDGGGMVVYSVARPVDADHPVDRSGVLAMFTFATPAFIPDTDGSPASLQPRFEANPVIATGIGPPGFARLFKANGSALADLSVRPGNTEIKLS